MNRKAAPVISNENENNPLGLWGLGFRVEGLGVQVLGSRT